MAAVVASREAARVITNQQATSFAQRYLALYLLGVVQMCRRAVAFASSLTPCAAPSLLSPAALRGTSHWHQVQ